MAIRLKSKRALKVVSKAKSKTQRKAFRLEEATITELHQAIRSGRTTLVEVVQRYLARVRAYNGVASMLVTTDGAPVPEAKGVVRAGSALRFPTQTVKASTILPDMDKYQGPPLEFGRMEATASNPDVQQQFGMIVGIPNAGQLNAIGTLNIRGERSVTCRGDFDRHPSQGPLPPGAPPSSTGATAASPISTKCRCTAWCSRSRIRSTPRTCARPAAATRATTSIFRRATTCWSSSFATKARSSSPRR